MERRLSLITLGVADLEQSRAFYERGLGTQNVGSPAEADGMEAPPPKDAPP